MERDPNKSNLVLSRKAGEELVIQFDGEIVRVMVVAIEGNRIKVGVECDKGIKVRRSELEPR